MAKATSSALSSGTVSTDLYSELDNGHPCLISPLQAGTSPVERLEAQDPTPHPGEVVLAVHGHHFT
jgi:hypothetical protein